jgi:hypothetical protein
MVKEQGRFKSVEHGKLPENPNEAGLMVWATHIKLQSKMMHIHVILHGAELREESRRL